MSHTTRLLFAATGAAVAVAALAVPSGPAAAAASCTAWGTLPARVALTSTTTTIRTTLHGSGCSGTVDNGATAHVSGPSSPATYALRWSAFGTTESDPLYIAKAGVGTYSIRGGDVQVYDANADRIASSWRTTSTVVKYGGRFTRARMTSGSITVSLQSYSASGWQGHNHVKVALQRRSSGRWTTIARTTSGSAGAVRFAPRSTHYRYRFVSAATGRVWSTTSKTF